MNLHTLNTSKKMNVQEVYWNRSMDELPIIQMLGIETVYITEEEDAVTIEFTVKKQHLNGNGGLHGGIIYLLCDQAIGTYATYHGRTGVTVSGSIQYYRPAKEGDVLYASVYEKKHGRRMNYDTIEVWNQDDVLVAQTMLTAMYTGDIPLPPERC